MYDDIEGPSQLRAPAGLAEASLDRTCDMMGNMYLASALLLPLLSGTQLLKPLESVQ